MANKENTAALWKKPVLWLFALTFAFYASTLSYQFTNFDDDAIISRNITQLQKPEFLLPSMLRDAEFQKQSIELYRPLQNLTFVLDTCLMGSKPIAFHLSSLLWFMLAIALLFLVMRELEFSPDVALWASLLYAIHPLFAYTLAWIPARGDILLSLWTLFAFLYYLKWRKHQKGLYLTAHLTGFALALLSKETAVMLVPLLWLYRLLMDKDKKSMVQELKLLPAYALLFALFWWMRSYAVYQHSTQNLSLSNFLSNLPALPESIFYFFVPFHLPLLAFYRPVITLAGSLLAALLLLMLYRSDPIRRPLMVFGLLWTLLFMLPGMAYRPEWSSYIYQYLLHRSFLPFVGTLLALSSYAVPIIKRWPANSSRAVFISLALILGASNLMFRQHFSKPLAFWETARQDSPHSAFAHLYYANELLKKNKAPQAIKAYTRALSLKPDMKNALFNRGVSYLKIKAFQKAKEDFSPYILLDSSNIMGYKYLGTACYQTKDYQQAVRYLSRYLHQKPEDKQARYQLGISLFMDGSYPEAYKQLHRLYRRHQDEESYARACALAALMAGKVDTALTINQRLLSLKPHDPTTLINQGYTYLDKGAYPKAMKAFELAANINSNNKDLLIGLMLCHYHMKHQKQTATYYQRFKKMFPGLSPSRAVQELQQQGYFLSPRQAQALKTLINQQD